MNFSPSWLTVMMNTTDVVAEINSDGREMIMTAEMNDEGILGTMTELEVLRPDRVMCGVVAVEIAVNVILMDVIMNHGDATATVPHDMT